MTSVDINKESCHPAQTEGKADVEALGLDKLDLAREGKAEETLSQPFLSFPIHNCPEKEKVFWPHPSANGRLQGGKN